MSHPVRMNVGSLIARLSRYRGDLTVEVELVDDNDRMLGEGGAIHIGPDPSNGRLVLTVTAYEEED